MLHKIEPHLLLFTFNPCTMCPPPLEVQHPLPLSASLWLPNHLLTTSASNLGGFIPPWGHLHLFFPICESNHILSTTFFLNGTIKVFGAITSFPNPGESIYLYNIAAPSLKQDHILCLTKIPWNITQRTLIVLPHKM